LGASHDIEQIDNRIKIWGDRSRIRAERVRVLTATGAPTPELNTAKQEALEATNNLRELNTQRATIKNASGADAPALNAAAEIAEDIARTEMRNWNAVRPGLEATAETARQAADAARRAGAANASALEDAARFAEKAVKDGEANVDMVEGRAHAARAASTVAQTSITQADGASINELEGNRIPNAHHAIEVENRERKRAYADYIGGGRVRNVFRAAGLQWAGDNEDSRREAKHKIIMEAEVEDKGGGGHH